MTMPLQPFYPELVRAIGDSLLLLFAIVLLHPSNPDLNKLNMIRVGGQELQLTPLF